MHGQACIAAFLVWNALLLKCHCIRKMVYLIGSSIPWQFALDAVTRFAAVQPLSSGWLVEYQLFAQYRICIHFFLLNAMLTWLYDCMMT
jgi:hypothetical protein